MSKITKRLVEGTNPGEKEVLIWDSDLKGFGVRIKPSGSSSYLIQYRNEFGRSRRLTLGPHGRLTAEEARRIAREKLLTATQGRDPAEERAEKRAVSTLTVFSERYLAEYAAAQKKSGTIETDRINLRCHILPALGHLPLTAISKTDIAKLNHSMKDRPGAANRTMELLSNMMNVAERWGLRPEGSNPCRGRTRYKRGKRERFLSAKELASLGDALAEAERTGSISGPAIAAIRLLIFTGCRRGEILNLRWDEVDFENRRLHFSDSKTGPRTIPLNAPALKVLANLQVGTDNPHVIAGRLADRALVDLKRPWKKIRELAGLNDVRLHDLRHTFASVAVNSGESLYMTGKLLGHAEARTTERYAHFADDPQKAATERLGRAIEAMLEGNKARVIPMKTVK
jgi:integrase